MGYRIPAKRPFPKELTLEGDLDLQNNLLKNAKLGDSLNANEKKIEDGKIDGGGATG